MKALTEAKKEACFNAISRMQAVTLDMKRRSTENAERKAFTTLFQNLEAIENMIDSAPVGEKSNRGRKAKG